MNNSDSCPASNETDSGEDSDAGENLILRENSDPSEKIDPASIPTEEETDVDVTVSDDVTSSRLPKAIQAFHSFLAVNSLPENTASAIVYQVHEDLRLVRGWSEIRIVCRPRIFLLAVAPPAYDAVFPNCCSPGIDRTQAVLPISTTEFLSPRVLDNICHEVRHPEKGNRFRCVTVAIVDQDSTTAYYRIFADFSEITHPQWKQKKRKRTLDASEDNEASNGEAESCDTKDNSSGDESSSGSSLLS